MNDIKGSCFCGIVQFQLNNVERPKYNFACHCSNCRKFNSNDFVHYAAVPIDQYLITKGKEKIGVIKTKPEGGSRMFCKECGGRVGCMLGDLAYVQVATLNENVTKDFLNLEAHWKYRERIRDVQDNLPKYQDIPQEVGGSGSKA